MKKARTTKGRKKEAVQDPPKESGQEAPKAKNSHVQKRNQNSHDPDELALTKKDIIEFCDRVLKKWQQDPSGNARNIPAMLAVRTSVFFSDEASLKAIWGEIISWVYHLLYQNAQAQARSEGESWAHVFSRIKDKD